MKKIIIIMTAILTLLLVSCSKPVEKMDIKLLYCLEGNFEPQTVAEFDKKFTIISDIEVDKDGNIYLFNPRLERILKFNSNGEFIKYFGSKGTWKGEFTNALDFVILNDTLYVKNTFTKIMIKYSLDGKYEGDFSYKDGRLQIGEVIRAVSNYKVVGSISSTQKDSNNVILKNKLILMNNKFEESATLREYSTNFNRNDQKYFEMITKFASGGNKIYVAENEEDKYKISVYNLEGERLSEIQKEYSRIEYNSAESDKINSIPILMKVRKDELDTLETKVIYKKSINALFYDKYGRLLVCPSVNRTKKNQNDFIVDIFENEKYVKTVVIPQLKGEDFLHRFDSEVYFIGDRIYEVLHKEMKVNVYEY